MQNYFLTILTFLLISGCKKSFEPPPGTVDTNVLIIDGTIGIGENVENTFTLSRLNTLSNDQYRSPELNAQLYIISDNGDKWALNEIGNGLYQSKTTLPENVKYKIQLQTSDGAKYESSFEKVIIPPPIDSITWELNDKLNIFVHTQDPSKNTRYYRWQFIETFERHSWYESTLEFVNNEVITRKDQIYSCWTQDTSQTILIKNTNTLTEDAVSYQLLKSITKPDDRVSVKYSMLVKQIGLTKEAFDFWNILKNNTELTGTLFDPQPSKLPTNILCTSDQSKKSIGYISVCKIQEKRLFIKNSELGVWPIVDESERCPVISDAPNKTIEILKRDNSYLPAYIESISGKLAIAKAYCVDCRIDKGTNIKPSYW